jgi:O-acetyl-ADP-ribose deacetylase (regulator of RNase III)
MLITKGDILQGLVPGHHTTVILHGCNCMNVMGAGIALYLKQKFPVVYEVDLSTQR